MDVMDVMDMIDVKDMMDVMDMNVKGIAVHHGYDRYECQRDCSASWV